MRHVKELSDLLFGHGQLERSILFQASFKILN